jgi:hypothetical protein
MARKQKKRASAASRNSEVPLEAMVGDMSVRELLHLLGYGRIVNTTAKQVTEAMEVKPSGAVVAVSPETRVVDLTVGQLLRWRTTGQW